MKFINLDLDTLNCHGCGINHKDANSWFSSSRECVINLRVNGGL
jgi:hypothetical protein